MFYLYNQYKFLFLYKILDTIDIKFYTKGKIMQITKRVTFIAKEGCEEDLKVLLEMMVIPSKMEDGCLDYNIYQYKENPRKFMAVETWESEEALNGHKNSPHYKVYKKYFEQYTENKYTDELDYLVTIKEFHDKK